MSHQRPDSVRAAFDGSGDGATARALSGVLVDSARPSLLPGLRTDRTPATPAVEAWDMLGEQLVRQTGHRADRAGQAASRTLRFLSWTHPLTLIICMYN